MVDTELVDFVLLFISPPHPLGEQYAQKEHPHGCGHGHRRGYGHDHAHDCDRDCVAAAKEEVPSAAESWGQAPQ